MLATARLRFAAVMNAIRGRAPVAPGAPASPDVAAILATVERMKADALAMQARADAMRDALAKMGRG